jgi:hypothetical protein
MKRLLLNAALMAAFFVWSCSSTPEEAIETSGARNWEFELVDSLQFNYLGAPIFADAEFEKVLFFDSQKQEFIILDEKGNLVSQFAKTGDAPDTFGFNLLLPSFLSKNEIMMPGTLGIFIFDLEGNFKKKIAYPEPQSGGVFVNTPGKSLDHFYYQNKNLIVGPSFRTNNLSFGDKEFYPLYKGLEIQDPETGEARAYAPFREGSRFLDGLGYINSDFDPVFAINGQEAFIAFAGEPILHHYSWESDSLTWKKSTPLELPDFGNITGKPLEQLKGIQASTNLITAAIKKVVTWNNLVLIHFWPGLSTEESESISELYQSGKEEAAKLRMENFYKNRKMGIAVVDPKNSQQLGPISFPDKVDSRGFVKDGDDFWFVKRFNPDQEEDFIRLYRYQLGEK